ncbi:restriction endonuclease [Luteibacter sp. PPL552]
MSGFKPVRHRYDDALTRVSWQDFERLVADHFRDAGYRVEHRGTGEGQRRTDGGIDLLLHRAPETILVQCKHWTAFQVPHNAVHELIGVMHTASATGAIVVTSGEFTKAAIEAAAKFRHVRLIDGRAVRAMLGPLGEPLPPLPTWVEVRQHRRPPPPSPRSHLVAAGAAIAVMGAALLGLYAYYLQEIEEARQMAMRGMATSAVTVVRPPPVVASPHPAPPTAAAIGAAEVPRATHLSRREASEWARQNAASMKILERTTPELR